jgi:alkaline phosphatase
MGEEHVKATGIYENGKAGSLSFESFPRKARITTHSANSRITDSAAAATAMATGKKVNNGVISVALRSDDSPLETILEHFKARGKSTGMVTTAFITHATPAAFGSHEPSRNNYKEIAGDYFDGSRPQVLFGGAMHVTKQMALDAGYSVVEDRESMLSIDTDSATLVSGQFGNNHMPYEFDGAGQYSITTRTDFFSWSREEG